MGQAAFRGCMGLVANEQREADGHVEDPSLESTASELWANQRTVGLSTSVCPALHAMAESVKPSFASGSKMCRHVCSIDKKSSSLL
jgi:hypothetical protein